MLKKNQLIKSIFNALGLEVSRKQDNKWNCWPRLQGNHVVFYEEDDIFHSNYDFAQLETQMSATDNPMRRLRHYTLVQLFRNSLKYDGDVVECGTFHGLSAYQIAQIMDDNNTDKSLHIFDSFEGLSEILEEDESSGVLISKDELRSQFSYGEDRVRDNLKSFDFIKYYKGWIPERFSEVKEIEFSFIHIDVDLYQPIKDSINFFLPRLVDGGIMVFDDYGFTAQFPGAKKAVDEAIANYNPKTFLALPSGQAFIIK